MSDSLGLSIGMTNLVAARIGRAPVMQRSILTLFTDRPPAVGAPSDEDADAGLELSGFVERVGDPVPLIAADGSPHRGERVLAEALDAMARSVGGGDPVAIAVPAHWGPATVGALRGALRAKPAFAPAGVPPVLIPDSIAAFAALQAAPGLPSNGVVVLADLGGSGTSITLADAGANFDAVGDTVRFSDFSGDQIDQALLDQVTAGVAVAVNADPSGTIAVGALTRLREQCRQAKERLSADTATVVPVELPGFQSDVRVTRTEVENLIAEPLAGLLAAIEETLRRNSVPLANVSAVATVGGGANIPLVTQQLSERLRAPIVTTPQSQLNVAAGAALIADRGVSQDAPTGMAAAGWAAGAAGLAASESASDGAASATFRALAWSQDDAATDEPVPYTGPDYAVEPTPTGARPELEFGGDTEAQPAEPKPLPWYQRPPLLFGAAAVAALLAIGGLAVTLTGTSGNSGPVTETATTVQTGPSPGEPSVPPTSQTVTVTGSDGRPSTTVVPPPPPPSTTTTSPTTTTTTESTTTTTTTTTATTTTTTATTTRTTTTTPPPTTTTQPPPTTTQPPPTTTAAPPTTQASPPTTQASLPTRPAPTATTAAALAPIFAP